MKKLSFFLALAATSITATAQTHIVGVFRDSLNNETEPYATVRLFREGQMNKPVNISLTKQNGEIDHTVDAAGNYIMIVSAIGKKEARRHVTVDGEPQIELGDVYTADAANKLGEVEIVAHQPVVSMETGKITYNMQNDADAKVLSALDMLRKVPMVTVDAQDNITVNGSSSFKVLVDGKPNIQLQSNARQILKSLPASVIEKVEVLANPGARYDAEGVGGVINLILHHDGGNAGQSTTSGYNGEAGIKTGNRGVVGTLYLAGQQQKISYNFNLYGGYGCIRGMDIYNRRQQYGNSYNTISTHQHADLSNPYTGATLSIDFELDSANIMNASLGMNYYNTKRTGSSITS